VFLQENSGKHFKIGLKFACSVMQGKEKHICKQGTKENPVFKKF
jgi:hypothetical protein